MKSQVCAIFATLLVLTQALYDTDFILNDEAISHINKQGLSWTAGRNERFEGITVAEVKNLLRTQKPSSTINRVPSKRISISPLKDIPTSFDARKQWPNCIHPILDQGKCGSCWAFAATESLSDRLCIASKGAVDVVLSPQSLVSCDWEGNMGCGGGTPQLAWAYMSLSGVATLECYPYTSGANGTNGACAKECKDGSDMKKYYSKSFSAHTYNTVESIQQSILQDGPVEGTFEVFSDFMAYKSGVYVKSASATKLGGHAIKIIGWGHDDASNKDYWTVANSWNTTWGLDGFFMIERGTNMCGIDRDACAGQAKVE